MKTPAASSDGASGTVRRVAVASLAVAAVLAGPEIALPVTVGHHAAAATNTPIRGANGFKARGPGGPGGWAKCPLTLRNTAQEPALW